jgi:hypothetical protein
MACGFAHDEYSSVMGDRAPRLAWGIFWKNRLEPLLKAAFIRCSSPPRYKVPMNARRPTYLRHLALLSLLACALGPGGTLRADERDHDLARQALEQGQVLPLHSVLDKVERDYQGQVLKIEFEHDDGRFIYEIRLLQDDGRMAKLKVDAVDGQVISMQRKEP